MPAESYFCCPELVMSVSKDELQILSRIPSDAKASDATLLSDVVCFFHAYHRLLRGFTVDNRLWY